MIDISQYTGLEALIHPETGELEFGAGVRSDAPIFRRCAELDSVFRDSVAAHHDERVVGVLYRAVRRDGDAAVLAQHSLRYDLTVTLPGKVGDEYFKTTGHYHPKGHAGIAFPEVYEVVHGRAAFVLQAVADVTAPRPTVSCVWVQVCEAGERIVIPPDCGHVSINIGTTPLVVADLISTYSGHIYGSFKALRGASYWVVSPHTCSDHFELVANPAYGELPLPVLRTGTWTGPLLDLVHHPVYAEFLSSPTVYAFLNTPGAVLDRLRSLWPTQQSGREPLEPGGGLRRDKPEEACEPGETS